MFERFTEKAIKVIMLSQEESRRLGHNFVGTEQILLGLIGEGNGIASKVLKSMGVNLKNARIEVEKIIGRGSGFVAIEIPFTPRAKRVLDFAIEESRQRETSHISTEHLLLGLIRETEGVAYRVLETLGINFQEVRTQVFQMLGQNAPEEPANNIAARRNRARILTPRVTRSINRLATVLSDAERLIGEIESGIRAIEINSEDVANAINELAESNKPESPGIKELLLELKVAIETENNLSSEDKAEAFEQVLLLAEIGKNPADANLQKLVRTAIKILKGTLAELPAEAKLVERCHKLLPDIAKIYQARKDGNVDGSDLES